MNIYASVAGQILRHFLTIAAGFLAAYGVVADMQSELVETTITIVVPVILAVVAQVWGYASKKHVPAIIQAAFEANPEDVSLGTVIEDVKAQGKGSGTIAGLFSLVIIGSLLATGCPSRSDIVKGFKTSEGIAGTVELSATNVGDLFSAGIIPYEAKEQIIAGLRIVQKNGKRFHAEVDALAKQYKGKLPDEKLKALDVLFSREVIAPFAEILVQVKLLSPEASEKVFAALIILRTAIFGIANIFGQILSQSESFEFCRMEENHVA